MQGAPVYIERVILGTRQLSEVNVEVTHMGWDERIRDDELVVRPR